MLKKREKSDGAAHYWSAVHLEEKLRELAHLAQVNGTKVLLGDFERLRKRNMEIAERLQGDAYTELAEMIRKPK